MRSLKKKITLMLLAGAITLGIGSAGLFDKPLAATKTSYILYGPANPPTGG